MSRNVFGWSLPPGCTHRMIEEQCEEGPCAVCAMDPADCLCPECHVCGEQGNPKCYESDKAGEKRHGLLLTKEQAISRQKARIRGLEQQVFEEQMALDMLEGSDVQQWRIDEVGLWS